MGTDPYSVIIYCAAVAGALWLVGVIALFIAVKKAKPEFRSKGFLRTPTGARWFRFLLFKHYDSFESPGVRFFFGVTHFCLLGIFLALGAVVLLSGSELMLQRMEGTGFRP